MSKKGGMELAGAVIAVGVVGGLVVIGALKGIKALRGCKLVNFYKFKGESIMANASNFNRTISTVLSGLMLLNPLSFAFAGEISQDAKNIKEAFIEFDHYLAKNPNIGFLDKAGNTISKDDLIKMKEKDFYIVPKIKGLETATAIGVKFENAKNIATINFSAYNIANGFQKKSGYSFQKATINSSDDPKIGVESLKSALQSLSGAIAKNETKEGRKIASGSCVEDTIVNVTLGIVGGIILIGIVYAIMGANSPGHHDQWADPAALESAFKAGAAIIIGSIGGLAVIGAAKGIKALRGCHSS